MPFPVYKSGPTVGEMFTVTCFACGMPSSKEWAQRVFCRPCQQEPFFPFLLETHAVPQGAVVMEDGTVHLCAFCHALLESQWNGYEGRRVPHTQRKYNVHKFICAVCGVETYRKRVRALPFQEFPFLVKGRQTASITLGNNPLAVVCLDCSETLWAQSAEYDRWGLPVHKRHFNWMARPPPPENSVDSAVARLPSGETQLPRCPPTDPLVPPKTNEPTALPEAIPPVRSVRQRADSMSYSHRYESPKQHVHQDLPVARKVSLGYPQIPVVDVHPPIVTVAPMSLHHYTQTAGTMQKSSATFTHSHIDPLSFVQFPHDRRRNDIRPPDNYTKKLMVPLPSNSSWPTYEDNAPDHETSLQYVNLAPMNVPLLDSNLSPWLYLSRSQKPVDKRSTVIAEPSMQGALYPSTSRSRFPLPQSSPTGRLGSPISSPIIIHQICTPPVTPQCNEGEFTSRKSSVRESTPPTSLKRSSVISVESSSEIPTLKPQPPHACISPRARRDVLLPKKRHWDPATATSCTDTDDSRSVPEKKRKCSTPASAKPNEPEPTANCAMDLSIPQSQPRNLPSNFSIAYLSQSESTSAKEILPIPVNACSNLPKEKSKDGLLKDETTICPNSLRKNAMNELASNESFIRKSQQEQRRFLSQLGLVMQQERMVLELESLSSRSKHGTIPPLKLRENSPQPMKSTSSESILVLREVDCDPAKTEFMRILGLFPSSSVNIPIPDRPTTSNGSCTPKASTSSVNTLCINYPSYASFTKSSQKHEKLANDEDSSSEVLKIPVLKKQWRRSSWLSSSCSSDSDEDGQYEGESEQLDNILRTSAAQWEATKRALAKVLKEMHSVSESDKDVEEHCRRIRCIRKHLKQQQLDLRHTHRLFKMVEKNLHPRQTGHFTNE